MGGREGGREGGEEGGVVALQEKREEEEDGERSTACSSMDCFNHYN